MSRSGNFVRILLKPFKQKEPNKNDPLETIAAQEQKQFPYETLVAATKNFHPLHKLGEGGFGPVYKGKLDDGREIAVKKLSQSSSHGMREFTNEAKLLSRVQNRNVVNLLGYCVYGADKLLVYEYVANESLDKHLFDSRGREALDWKRRHDIIIGIAHGLQYLHEDSPSVITHQDIKAGNILLDDKWVPKIAGFGMARLFPKDQTHVNTQVSGTNGYMAPEYSLHGYLSPKADVFSFGVLVLELISGQKNSSFIPTVDAQNLLEWAYKLYQKGKSLEVMDPALASSAIHDQVAMFVQIGLLCTQSDPTRRPIMRRVVLMLSKKPGTIEEEPMKPGYPGSRYRRRPRKLNSSSSSCGCSVESNSNTLASTANSSTATANTAYHQRSDPHGKRPMQGYTLS
ncbi:Non-specific serine/threonine protein kinase [Bertholletia excelsa]